MGAKLSIPCVNVSGRSLINAACTGSADTVREVLEARPELASYTFFGSNYTVMHHASAKGNAEVLRAVVETLQTTAKDLTQEGTGSDNLKEQTISVITWGRYLKDVLNARTSQGQTPLMLACEQGHVSCVNYLLESGCDVFAVDRAQRRSAIHYAATNGRAGVLRKLLADSTVVHTEEGIQPLKHVRVHDMSGQCRYIDSRAENGVTALHLAAVHGDLACVLVLLQAGASMMVRTVDLDMVSTLSIPAGSTPLHLAAQRGQVAIVQAMLQAHADALGMWGRNAEGGRSDRRGWEGDGRIDLRSVANSLRQLPYHCAWQRGFREAAGVLNPTVPIDVALENVREMDEGFGPQNLSTLSAYALRRNHLAWLEAYKSERESKEKAQQQRALTQRVIADQRRKEALKLHSQASAENSLAALDARLISPHDAGHTFSLPPSSLPAQALPPPPRMATLTVPVHSLTEITLTEENSDELRRESSNQASTSMAAPVSMGASHDQPAPPQPLPTALPSTPAAQARQPAIRGNTDRRLRPTRPPPPPPMSRLPSASERALALATLAQPISPRPAAGLHPTRSRVVSFDGQLATSPQWEEPDGPEGSVQSGWFCTPFPSPFAQASQMNPLEDEQRSLEEVPDNGSMDGMPEALPISTHESGIDLAPLPTEPQRDNSIRNLVSRKSSTNLRRTLSSFRSKKSLKGESLKPMGDLWRAASIAGFDNNLDDDEDCGICLDEMVNVGINGCNHKLCCTCAIRLCEVNKKPPLCPFCRTFIEGFHGVAMPSETK